MKRNTLLIFSIAALTFSACGDDDGRNPTNDGGSDDATMDAPINTPEGGTPDGSKEDAAKPRRCAPDPTTPTEAACSADLAPCIQDCSSKPQGEQEACVTACQNAEMPACANCISAVVLGCSAKDGDACFAAYQAAACCQVDNNCQDASCVTANCSEESAALQSCATGQTVCIQQAYSVCLPAAESDGGAPDATVDAGA